VKTLVLSDLHLGPDHVAPIYAGTAALPALIREHAEQPLRVVLNGDTFDLLLDDAPLALDANIAAERTRACAESNDGAPLMTVLAHVLQRGGELVIRAGNHDLELALPAVQQELTDVLVQAGAPRGNVQFANDDEPYRFDDGELRVLITHGENQDPFNRWTRAELAGDGFTYPPGSTLVKEILNPLKREMRFIDLLKPDFHGAVLGALAVKPRAVRTLLKLSTLEIISKAVARSFGESPFAPELALPFEGHLIDAQLDTDEGEELLDFLDGSSDDVPYAEGGGTDSGLLTRAFAKLGRAALATYAATHRLVGGHAGGRFFSEEPEAAEWHEARRLRDKYGVNVVVSGHSHVKRFGAQDGVTYANTGTWIVLMQLPVHDAPIAEWSAFLAELAADPHLERSTRTRLLGTACLIDAKNHAAPVQLLGSEQSPPASWHARRV